MDFSNKTVLVTGAAGSIGGGLSRTIAKLKPKLLVLLDNNESGLFDIYEELKEQCDVDYVIGDIRDLSSIREVFTFFKPNIVYHAAAYENNVWGTEVVSMCAKDCGVEKFVLISSDKAVNPVCVMGKTKKECEDMCLRSNNEYGTKFIVVRFGNVMASRGSVVPIFQKCIQENKSLPVTHPDMERYWMGIYEAADLVLKATEIGEGGEIFVLDMGVSMKIVDLAKMMIKLSGKPLDIVFTHPNEGEKMSEILMTEEEEKRAVKVDDMWIIK